MEEQAATLETYKKQEAKKLKEELREIKRSIYLEAYRKDFIERLEMLLDQSTQYQFENRAMFRKTQALIRMLMWAKSYIFEEEEDVDCSDGDDLDFMREEMLKEIKEAENDVREILQE